MDRYECQGCGAVSEDRRDAELRVCQICGLHEAEVAAERERRVRLAEYLERIEHLAERQVAA